jgi:hypothetical protein
MQCSLLKYKNWNILADRTVSLDLHTRYVSKGKKVSWNKNSNKKKSYLSSYSRYIAGESTRRRVTRGMFHVLYIIYSLALWAHSLHRVSRTKSSLSKMLLPHKADPYLLSIRISEIRGKVDFSCSLDWHCWGFRSFTHSSEIYIRVVNQTSHGYYPSDPF